MNDQLDKAMDIDDDDDTEEPTRCLTGFSSLAAVGNLIATEESRNLSALLSEFAHDSDDEEPRRWGGSQPGKSANVLRDFKGANDKLVGQCFNGEASLYTEVQFRRRFCVSSAIFKRVYNTAYGKGCFFPPGKKDATG